MFNVRNPSPERRSSFKKLGQSFVFVASRSSLVLGCDVLRAQSTSSESVTPSQASAISQIGLAFLERTGIPGLSVAFGRYGQMVHQEAFGFANLERKEKLNPTHSFRIASVSKPITATVTFALVERGKLRLSDVVFGTHGILGMYGPTSTLLQRVTVQHLLSHSSGAWGRSGKDPMFSQVGLSHAELIDWTLKNLPLLRDPGTTYDYSNFGYCLLGRIIEKVTGKSYSTATQELVLSRAGISRMHIASNGLAQKAPNEVLYYTREGEDAYTMNLSRMDSHGGWVATPGDLVKFASSVDGLRPGSNILQSASINAMTRPSATNPAYANGWAVNSVPNWWHSGSLPGTTSLVVRTASGMCWAACANARTPESGAALDEIMWGMARSVPAWKA